jgi:hypothetical protein
MTPTGSPDFSFAALIAPHTVAYNDVRKALQG